MVKVFSPQKVSSFPGNPAAILKELKEFCSDLSNFDFI